MKAATTASGEPRRMAAGTMTTLYSGKCQGPLMLDRVASCQLWSRTTCRPMSAALGTSLYEARPSVTMSASETQ